MILCKAEEHLMVISMTNQEIIEMLPTKNEVLVKIREIKDQVLELAKEQDRLEEIVDYLSKVDFIHNGIAINNFNGNKFRPVGQNDSNQYAEYYPNAHNDGATYGVRVKDSSYSTDCFIGNNFTLEEAKKLCLDFVTGTISSRDFQKKYCKWS